jgi:hypothetical protein
MNPTRSRRLFSRLTLVATALTGLIGLAGLAAHENREPRTLGANNTVYAEVVAIYAPAKLIAFARSDDARAIPSHAALRGRLTRLGLERAWYAIAVHGYVDNGTETDVTYVRRPFEWDWQWEECRGVLATLAGAPPRGPDMDYTRARVEVIPESLLGMEPLGALAEMVK